jgi:hypothetical protein
LSNLTAPRPTRLPPPKPTTIKPKDSRYERGTTGGQVSGRPPMPLETMLRVYFLQNWYALNDPMAEETLYDSEAMRRCIDPAESAQVKPLMRMPQRGFSCRAPDVGAGCCRS